MRNRKNFLRLRTSPYFLATVFYLLTFAYSGEASRCERFVAIYSDAFFSNSKLASWIAESTPVEADAVWDIYSRIVLGVEEGTEVTRAADLLNRLAPAGRMLALRQLTGRVLLYDRSYLDSLEATDDLIPQAGLVADIGCAAGYTCSYLAFERPDRRFILMDYDPNFTLAARHNLDHVTSSMNLPPDRNVVLRANARQLVLPAQSVDGVVTNFVIQHLPAKEQLKLMQAIATSLVPGGVVVIHEPSYHTSAHEDPEFEDASRMADAIRQGAVYRRSDFWMMAAAYRGLVTGIDDPPDRVWGTLPTSIQWLAKSAGLSVVGETFRGPDYFRMVLQKPY